MSTTLITVEQLQRIPIFRNMTDNELHHLAEIVQIESYEPGDNVLLQNRCSQNLWVIMSGECEIVRESVDKPGSEPVVLASIGPYSHFGEMSFFHTAPHSASVRAKSKIEVLRLQREAYDQLIDSNDIAAYKLAFNTVESLADRLRAMDRWVAELQNDCQGKEESNESEWNKLQKHLFDNWNL